jgi:hypothetical protein
MPEIVHHVLGFISKYKIFGVIPLNATLHFTISILITIILLNKKVKITHIIFFIFFLGLAKEVLDSFVLNNTMLKHFTDMCINLFYPTLIFTIRKLKNKPDELVE